MCIILAISFNSEKTTKKEKNTKWNPEGFCAGQSETSQFSERVADQAQSGRALIQSGFSGAKRALPVSDT